MACCGRRAILSISRSACEIGLHQISIQGGPSGQQNLATSLPEELGQLHAASELAGCLAPRVRNTAKPDSKVGHFTAHTMLQVSQSLRLPKI